VRLFVIPPHWGEIGVSIMPATALLRQRPRTLLIAAAVPLALAAVVYGTRMRRRLEAADRELEVAGRELEAARRDQLTGLYGRRALYEHGEQLLAHGCPDDTAVLLLDGVGFKTVNDDYGHAAGDTVVVALAHRLHQWGTDRDALVVRLGGDEFAAIVQIPRADFAQELAALRAHMEGPVPYEGLELSLAVSIGAVYVADLPGCSWSTVLHVADVSMYRVKRGEADFPYLGTPADAATETVNGRRPGRPGTHLPAPAAAA